MSDYSVEWSMESIYDVADLAEYIEQSFGKERADRFNDDTDETIAKLSFLHSAYSGTEIFYRGMLIRKVPIGPSIVFYTADDYKQKVYVLRVLRHERDWQRILREQIVYTFKE